MLPERKRNLVIAGIAIVVLIIVIILIIALSNYVRNKNKESTRADDDYANNYTYYGIMKDQDSIYRLYGISKDKEEYLNLKTLYDVVDVKVQNNHLVIYSDAVNEVRYEKDDNEYYFYELDQYYNYNYKKMLSKDYLVLGDKDSIRYAKYGSNMKDAKVVRGLKSDNYLVKDNMAYVIKDDGIYQVNLVDEKLKVIVPMAKENLEIVALSGDYFLFFNNKELYFANLNTNLYRSIDNIDNVLEISNEGFLYIKDSTLYNYSLRNQEVVNSYFLGNEEILKCSFITDNKYLMKIKGIDGERSVIFDVNKMKEVKKLENDYMYMGVIK